MEWIIPGTILTADREQPASAETQLRALFLAGGMVRSQVTALTGLESHAVQNWVKRLRDFITEHYYTCTKPILKGLGMMYADGGSMTENIDAAGGKGTGAFALRAIEVFCK